MLPACSPCPTPALTSNNSQPPDAVAMDVSIENEHKKYFNTCL